jgi:hypothetical protein
MIVGSDKVRCGACDTLIQEVPGLPPELRQACPHCGSRARKFAQSTGGEIAPVGNLKSRGFRANASKWFIEVIKGADWSVGLKRWARKLRTIDKEHDLYSERVVDPLTGEILHDVSEPLSRHTDHGSARKS